MSTWHIISDADSKLRWEVSAGYAEPQSKPYGAKPTPHTLPSMADLLLEGHSKIQDNRRDDHLFRTASGASLLPKQHSSVSKALAVLADYDNAATQSGAQPDGCGLSNSLFQTASGKKVTASSAALARAKTLLGHDQVSNHPSSQGFQSIKGDATYESDQFTHSKKRSCGANAVETSGVTPSAQKWSLYRPDLPSNGFLEESAVKHAQTEMPRTSSAVKPPPIKFNTAGGRSISVSADALKRARSLLGDPELGTLFDKVDACDAAFPVLKESNLNLDYVNKENDVNFSHAYKEVEGRKQDPKCFISSSQTSSTRNHLAGISMNKNSADKSHNLNSSVENLLYEKPQCSGSVLQDSSYNGGSRISSLKTSSKGALLHTTTSIGTNHCHGKQGTGDLKRIGRKSYVSPFKRPRSSKFTYPLNDSIPLVPSGISNGANENLSYKKRVSTRYPAQISRIYIKDFFKVPPTPSLNMNLREVRQINPGNAEKYVFCENAGVGLIDVEAFRGKLAQSGASLQYASKEWVSNHYKWIVWKLASYERLSSTKYHGFFFSVPNVIEELKYRYEREVNHGHRSALKKILEGDASPSSVLILCISSVCHNNDVEVEADPVTVDESERRAASTIELTDGWYSINARLDIVLSEYLALGKLFVGQKLRICGARLCGWTQPVSPLEAPRTISLLLHANGTYRACWADRLGFSRDASAPLAFTCIKSSGGPVPRVLVGVTRIYPVLYREKVGNEGCIVRSEKEEAEVMRIYNQRCSNIIEGVTSDFCRGNYCSGWENDHDSEEGANILKMLENAFEPEVLMAEMSPEQLASVTNYQAKLESRRQLDIERTVKKALEDARLSTREVTPFMRLRVIGLTYEGGRLGKGPKEGLVTVWNPTEKQQLQLVEGQAYAMSGLVPLHSNPSTLFLHGRGSTLNWQPITSSEKECFVPFFSPREPVLLSKLVEIPLSSEFDTAVLVLYVGKEYVAAHQKRQWVFVTDGSTSELENNESTISLLAINFCSSCSDDYAVSPVNCNLTGSVVGFCNLIKRSKDEMNDLWVADATANTTYHLNYDYTHFSHLNQAVASVQKWKNRSSMIVEKLRKKVLSIIGDSKM